MSVLKEFKEFAVRGNVIDMAVGVIIGGAFGKIVTSFVNDVVMPPIGKLVGGVNFSELYCNLSDATYNSIAEATAAGAPIVKYGAFIQTIIDFTIVAFVIFMAVKGINSLKKKEVEAAPAAPAEDVVLLKEIRDLLKK